MLKTCHIIKETKLVSPAYIFTGNNKVTIMSLKKQTEQVSFKDLECEGEYTDGDNKKVFYTITGKEEKYNPDWETYKNYECDVGDELTGYPEITIFEKEDKTYNALRLRIIDETTDEVLDCYCNYPKKDAPYVKGLNKEFDFYRNAFDFIFSIRRCQGEKYVVDKNGEEYNKFPKVDFIGHAKLVDQMNKVTVQITAGNEDSDYNSWQIINME